MLALVAAAVIGQASAPIQTITYDTKAKPIQAVLTDIAAQTHLRLTVGAELAKQPIIVSVHDAPLKEFFANVAKATYGIWVNRGDSYELDLDGRRVQDASDAYRRMRVAFYQKILNVEAKRLQAQGPISASAASQYFAQQQAMEEQAGRGQNPYQNARTNGDSAPIALARLDSPLSRAGKEILIAVGAEALAGLSKSDRAVYCTNPTAMQHPVGNLSDQILGEYLTGAAIWKQASDKAKAMNPQGENKALSFGLPSEYGQDADPAKTIALLVVVQNTGFGLVAEVFARHSDGKLGGPGMVTLSASEDDIAQNKGPDKTEQANDSDVKASGESEKAAQPLTYSDGAKTVAAAMKAGGSFLGSQLVLGSFGLAQAPKVSPALLSKLKRPDTYDPLSFGDSEALIQYAEIRKLQLVALLPDSAVSTLSTCTNDAELEAVLNLPIDSESTSGGVMQSTSTTVVTINSDSNPIPFFNDSGSDPQIQGTIAGKWLDVSSSNPGEMLRQRMERGAASKLLDSWADPKSSKLEALSSFFASRYRLDNQLVSKYLGLFSDKSMQAISVPSIAFYGNLSSSEREQLLSGAVFAYRNLNAEAQEALAFSVYMNATPLSEQAPDTSLMSANSFSDAVGGLFSQIEPTESLPNGIPADTRVSLNQNHFKEARVSLASLLPPQLAAMAPAQMPDINMDLGPMELAGYKLMKSDPRFTKSFLSGMTLSKMRLLDATKLQFEFQFAPKLFATASLTDKSAAGDQVYTWDSLPADLEQQIASQEGYARAELAKVPADALTMPKMFPQQNKPPS